MQFLVLGYDGNDDEALERRMKVREDHIAVSEKYIETNNQIIGAAILDDDDKMVGSAMIVEFDTREEFDEWLALEPYVTGDVWREIKVHNCRVGPSFQHLLNKS